MKTIALIAHDEKKDDMVEFVQKHFEFLSNCNLISTGTTGKVIMENVNLKINRMESGPLGGDQMVGAEVAKDKLNAVIFLRDPLTAQPHEPDISALLRVCDVHNVPLATNVASAHFILKGLINS
ncbi:MAG: methylglyoxal synthase [Bacillota bacterium]